MKKFKVTHDHNKYRPASYLRMEQELKFVVKIEADSLDSAKKQFTELYRKNAFYFKFQEV